VLLAGGGLAAAAVGAGATLAATGLSGAAPDPAASPDPAVIPPDDDLMREHGVLKRVLLVYRELMSRVQAGQRLPAAQAHDAALIVHDFIEGFHEGLEEGYVFPRLRQAGQLESTVTTLLVQHARGRVLTQFILTHTPAGAASAGTAADLAAAMSSFVRMYEPHEARADLFVDPGRDAADLRRTAGLACFAHQRSFLRMTRGAGSPRPAALARGGRAGREEGDCAEFVEHVAALLSS